MSATHIIARTLSQSTATIASRLSAEQLCSAENRARCMKRLRSIPDLKLYAEREGKTAAVLIPLCVHENRLSLLYTIRSANLNRHSNEVSFPGGIRDATDESFTACALRETQEEVGIAPESIDIWGETRIIESRHGINITPVVGFIQDYDASQLRINPDEVAEVFVVPLELLCHPSNMRHTQFQSGLNGYSMPVFMFGRYRIWGLTGYMTHMMLTALLPDDLYGSRKLPFVRPSKI